MDACGSLVSFGSNLPQLAAVGFPKDEEACRNLLPLVFAGRDGGAGSLEVPLDEHCQVLSFLGLPIPLAHRFARFLCKFLMLPGGGGVEVLPSPRRLVWKLPCGGAGREPPRGTHHICPLLALESASNAFAD